MGKGVGILGIPMLQIRGGYARKTAIDLETGARFIQYDIDYLAGETPDECCIPECQELVDHGWLCLDGGEMYCEDHVSIVDDLTEGEESATIPDDTDRQEKSEATEQGF